MALPSRRPWRPGGRLLLRGSVWRVLERSAHLDCEALRVRPARDTGAARTFLVPFDRPRPVPEGTSIRVVRSRDWLHGVLALHARAAPAGALSDAARSTIAILPYQLEPALLMRRDGVARVMIADGVGLGKTIQAGVLLSQLASERDDFRALIIVPAGLRGQWRNELSTRFGLETLEASSAWLARVGSELPVDVNPWGLPGVYVTSVDLVKRAEVLRPIEDVTWDLVVVDEAHDANVGTARRAAVHAAGCRARRVVLLTATPHAGDSRQFEALCDIGAHDAGSPSIVMFRRTSANARPHASRRTRVFPVRLGSDERRMHRLLGEYATRVCHEARSRGDASARLMAVVLRKRALSSAASLVASCRRRLSLLQHERGPADERQLALPLDEEPLADLEPDAVLGAAGLADVTTERRLLEEIGRASERASRNESKIQFLKRLLRRIDEPAIVFTEYRDTLVRLRRELQPVRADVQLLHGGMDLRERAAATNAFNECASLLLATDAASEGLNLHARCRLVIHFELPWSPARLEQRTGRVDRIGQTRRVHEALLVANDTAERLVLAPLVTRTAKSRSAVSGDAYVAEALKESDVVAAVIDGVPPVPQAYDTRRFVDPPAALAEEAVSEANRLADLRGLPVPHRDCAAVPVPGPLVGSSLHRPRSITPGLVAVYVATLLAADGSIVHTELAAAHVNIPVRRCRNRSAVRELLTRFRETGEPAVRAVLLHESGAALSRVMARCENAAAAAADRERAILRSLPSAAAQLVQAGLFDQRALRAAASRRQRSAARVEDGEFRLDALAAASRLEVSLHLAAALVATGELP